LHSSLNQNSPLITVSQMKQLHYYNREQHIPSSLTHSWSLPILSTHHQWVKWNNYIITIENNNTIVFNPRLITIDTLHSSPVSQMKQLHYYNREQHIPSSVTHGWSLPILSTRHQWVKWNNYIITIENNIYHRL
jgi:hypothetical protein